MTKVQPRYGNGSGRGSRLPASELGDVAKGYGNPTGTRLLQTKGHGSRLAPTTTKIKSAGLPVRVGHGRRITKDSLEHVTKAEEPARVGKAVTRQHLVGAAAGAAGAGLVGHAANSRTKGKLRWTKDVANGQVRGWGEDRVRANAGLSPLSQLLAGQADPRKAAVTKALIPTSMLSTPGAMAPAKAKKGKSEMPMAAQKGMVGKRDTVKGGLEAAGGGATAVGGLYGGARLEIGSSFDAAHARHLKNMAASDLRGGKPFAMRDIDRAKALGRLAHRKGKIGTAVGLGGLAAGTLLTADGARRVVRKSTLGDTRRLGAKRLMKVPHQARMNLAEAQGMTKVTRPAAFSRSTGVPQVSPAPAVPWKRGLHEPHGTSYPGRVGKAYDPEGARHRRAGFAGGAAAVGGALITRRGLGSTKKLTKTARHFLVKDGDEMIVGAKTAHLLTRRNAAEIGGGAALTGAGLGTAHYGATKRGKSWS